MTTHRELVVGLDEAGRGALAGPVIAAAVILPADRMQDYGLTDSKKLTAKARERLAGQIMEHAVAFAVGRAEASEIDDINILQASLLAMARAVSALPVVPDRYIVDGTFCPHIPIPGEAVVKADLLFPEVSAASILAKVYRDREMMVLDALHSGYGFAGHKGYPTATHQRALESLGVSIQHRKSYAPVKRVMRVHQTAGD